MFDKIIAHTSFIGETGYANHSRNFFTALNKFIPVKVRNFAAGKTWTGLNNGEPHDNEWYLTEDHKEMLYKQTCMNNGTRTDHYIYGGSEDDEKGDILHIVLNEVDHYYFYDEYNGPKIAYNVWESNLYPEHFYKKLLEFDQLWVPTKWQKECVINQGYNKDKIKIIPEAINSEVFFPEDFINSKKLEEYKDDRFKFLLFGRWDYRKSTKEIIETFLKTFNKEEPVDLIVSIDNPFSCDGIKSTEERLKYYGFNDSRIKIKHFPSRGDYIKYLKTGHVFLSCARSEGWNLPLIESLSCGTPSLYSKWGAQLEFAEGKGVPVSILGEKLACCGKDEGFNSDIPGNYCEPDFKDLSLKMRESYYNYKEIKEKSLEDSKKIIDNFTWEKMAEKADNEITQINNSSRDIKNILFSRSFEGCHGDSYFIDEVCNKKVYEKYFEVEKGDVVVDIGSHIGSFAFSIQDTLFDKCYCIEPCRDNVISLEKNISNMKDSRRYFVEECAIDEKTGNNFFKLTKMGVHGLSKSEEDEIIKCLSFKDFISKYKIEKIDFLKIDCEGGEYFVFNDEENLSYIKDNVKKIAGEIHLNQFPHKIDVLDIVDNLSSFGFKVILNSVDGVDITNYFRNNVDYYKEILFYAEKIDEKSDKEEVVFSYDDNFIHVYNKNGKINVEVRGESEHLYYVVFKNKKTNYTYYETYISNNCWAAEGIDNVEFPNNLDILVVCDDLKMFWVTYKKEEDLFSIVKRKSSSYFMDKVKDPIIITGSIGGGTSYTSKLLRYNSIYFGTDSGDIDTRKAHESNTFYYPISFLINLISRDKKTLRNTEYKELINIKNNIKNNIDKYVENVRDAIIGYFDEFWGDYDIGSSWGFKMPTNSIVYPIWEKIFPNAKLLIVNRKDENSLKYSSGKESLWRSNKSSDIIDLYTCKNEDIKISYKHIDFDNFISDVDSFNDVIKWCGLKEISTTEYEKTLLETKKGDTRDNHIINQEFIEKERKESKPLFSIVTSFYNNSKEQIEDVYKSILSQTYQNWEWIITDDFSENSQFYILKKISEEDDRIRYINQNEKQEIYWNPQKYANGEYICQLDSDDALLPNALDVLYYMFVNHDDCICLMSNSNHYKNVFEKEKYCRSRYCYYPSDFSTFLDYYPKYLDNKIDGGKFGEAWGGLRAFRNSFSANFDFRDGIDCSLGKSEDMIKILNLEEMGKILYIERPLNKVREREDSHGHKYGRFDYDKIISDFKKRRQDKNIELKEPTVDFTYSHIKDKLYSFYISDLTEETNRKKALCFNFNCDDKEQELIQDLYFDHNISFDFVENPDYVFCIANDFDDVKNCINIIEHDSLQVTKCAIQICNDKNLEKEIISYLQLRGESSWKFTYASKYTYIYFNLIRENLNFEAWCDCEDENQRPKVFFKCHDEKSEGKYEIILKDSFNNIQLYHTKMDIKQGLTYWVHPGGIRKHLNGVLLEIRKNNKLYYCFKREFHNKYPFTVKDKKINLRYPSSDGEWFVFYEIFEENVYHHQDCFIEEDDVILDIGANYGIFDLYAIDKGVSKIYSYEPVKTTYDYCVKNTKNYSEIDVFNKAVGKETGKSIIKVSKSSLGTSHMPNDNPFHRDAEEYQEEEIDVISINDVLENYKNINFIKIDCEGYEYNIFEAIEECFLKNNIKKIMGEYHFDDGFKLNKIINKLKRCGFTCDLSPQEGTSHGMFYAWKQDNEVLNNKDDIIIVNTYADTLKKKDVLKKCLNQLKKTGIEIAITTHYPLDEDVVKIADHVIYDSFNPKLDISDYYWFGNDSFKLKTLLSRFSSKNSEVYGGHGLAALTSMNNGVNYAKSIEKKFFYHIEYDNVIHDDDIEKFVNLKKNIKNKGKYGYFEKYKFNDNQDVFSMLFFCSDIDKFLSYFYVPRDKKKYREMINNASASEVYLYKCLKDYIKDLYIGERSGRKIGLFKNSSKALCDINEDVNYIDIVPDKDRKKMHLFMANHDINVNKIEYEIKIDDNSFKKITLFINEYYIEDVTDKKIVKIKRDGKEIFNKNVYDCKCERKNDEFIEFRKNKDKYFICLDSKSLGDTLAWVPYAEEFRKEHNCEVILSTFWNNLFEKVYPEIKFIGRGETVDNINKQYNIGWYTPWDENKNPNDFRTIPLQKTASDILELEFKEIKPKITIPDKKRNIEEKYVCIGMHSTAQAKYWNNPNGWQEVVDYLNDIGYKVVHISKESGEYMGNHPPKGIIDKTGDFSIEDRIIDLKYADMYIGTGSGLSWLAWATETPTILISGFSAPWCEPQDNVERIINPYVCNSCFNDPDIQFDPGDWNWCPRNNNFECSKEISPERVINSINKIIREKRNKK